MQQDIPEFLYQMLIEQYGQEITNKILKAINEAI